MVGTKHLWYGIMYEEQQQQQNSYKGNWRIKFQFQFPKHNPTQQTSNVYNVHNVANFDKLRRTKK